MAVNSADDLVNPPELGILEREIKRVPRGRAVMIPLSDRTAGHGTHTLAAVWKSYLEDLLRTSGPSAATNPAPAGPNPDVHYQLGPDSLPHDGVPKGEVRGPFTLPSQAYPGTQHTYWVYVPAQYDPAVAGQPDDFQGRAGVQEHGGRRPGAERARQPDLSARDSR